MEVKIVKTKANLQLPKKMTSQSAAYDLYACEGVWIKEGEIVEIPLGFRMEMMDPGFPVCAKIYSRSSQAKRGIVVHAGPKIIDQDYRGEVIVPMKNEGEGTVWIYPHERIAQMMLEPHLTGTWRWAEHEDLSETNRNGGFGSTGKF